MQPIVTNLAALTVAMLYYVWRAHHEAQLRRQRILCRRVAYLLWAVANQIKSNDSAVSAS